MAFYPPQGSIRQQPQSPPPPYVPPKPVPSHYIIDCLNQFTYIWLINGEGFWFYPTSVEYGAVSGYRWTGTFWTFYVLMEDLSKPLPVIQSLLCTKDKRALWKFNPRGFFHFWLS